MNVKIVCGCNFQFRVDTIHAGKQVRCPQCQQVHWIPAAPSSGSSTQAPAPVSPAPSPPPASAPAMPNVQAANSHAPQPAPTRPQVTTAATPNRVPQTTQSKPTSVLQIFAILTMVYGAFNAILSLYYAMQTAASVEMVTDVTRMVDIPGGAFMNQFFYSAEKLTYLSTALCLVFGAIQFSGGLSALMGRYTAFAFGGAILMMVPCLGSAFPLTILLTFPIGLVLIILLIRDEPRRAAQQSVSYGSLQKDPLFWTLSGTGGAALIGVVTMIVFYIQADSTKQAKLQKARESGRTSLTHEIARAQKGMNDFASSIESSARKARQIVNERNGISAGSSTSTTNTSTNNSAPSNTSDPEGDDFQMILSNIKNSVTSPAAIEALAKIEPNDEQREQVVATVLSLNIPSAYRRKAMPILQRWVTKAEVPLLLQMFFEDRSQLDPSELTTLLYDLKEKQGAFQSVLDPMLPVLTNEKRNYRGFTVLGDVVNRGLGYEDVPAILEIIAVHSTRNDRVLFEQLDMLNDPRVFEYLPTKLLEKRGPLVEPILLARLENKVRSQELYDALSAVGTVKGIREIEASKRYPNDSTVTRCIDAIKKARRRSVSIPKNYWNTFITHHAIHSAEKLVVAWEQENGTLPTQEVGNALVENMRDGWRRQLIYAVSDDDRFAIRSVGPNGKEADEDDLVEVSPAVAPASAAELILYLQSGDFSKQSIAMESIGDFELDAEQKSDAIKSAIGLLNNKILKEEADSMIRQSVDSGSSTLLHAAANDFRTYPVRDKDFVKRMATILADLRDGSVAPFLNHSSYEVRSIAEQGMKNIDIAASKDISKNAIETLRNPTATEAQLQQALKMLAISEIKDSNESELRSALHAVLLRAAKVRSSSGAVPRSDLGYLSLQVMTKLGFSEADLTVLMQTIDKYPQEAKKGLVALSDSPKLHELLEERLLSPKTNSFDPIFSVLSNMGAKGEQIALKGLQHSDPSVRVSVMRILSSIGSQATLQHLQTMELDSSARVRKSSAWLVDKLKVTLHNDPEALDRLVAQHNVEFNYATLQLLRSLGTGAEPLVWSSLKAKSEYHRQSACTTLQSIGTAKSTPYLTPLLQDPNESVVRAAKSAIEEIKKENRSPKELWSK